MRQKIKHSFLPVLIDFYCGMLQIAHTREDGEFKNTSVFSFNNCHKGQFCLEYLKQTLDIIFFFICILIVYIFNTHFICKSGCVCRNLRLLKHSLVVYFKNNKFGILIVRTFRIIMNRRPKLGLL